MIYALTSGALLEKEVPMKNIILFCTKPWFYLTEIPVIAIFWLALTFNKYSEGIFKFYPLMIVSAFFIVFIMIYFFRAISINNDEIRSLGVFSSKDSALIDANKTLVIALHPRFNMKLELYTDASEAPAFDWMKANDVAHRDICIFREKAVGGKRSAEKILKYFTVPKDVSAEALKDGFCFENDFVKVNSTAENEVIKIKIKFKTTII